MGSEITDTQRLDFILRKGRRVQVEVAGYNGKGEEHFEVRVIQGAFDDIVFPLVRYTGTRLSAKKGLQLKREAIDLAINDPRGKDPA